MRNDLWEEGRELPGVIDTRYLCNAMAGTSQLRGVKVRACTDQTVHQSNLLQPPLRPGPPGGRRD